MSLFSINDGELRQELEVVPYFHDSQFFERYLFMIFNTEVFKSFTGRKIFLQGDSS